MKALLPFVLALTVAACGSTPGGDFVADADRQGYSDRIAGGLTRLGASDDRSRCFSQRLSGDPKIANEAARIVEDSADKDDMRRRVLSADRATKQAFIGANFGCSLSG